MNKFDLIKRNTQEIVEEKELKKLLKEKKEPVVYIGYAPTGLLHVGHFVPILKLGDFLTAGFKAKFLIADLHAFLDDQKTEWHLLDDRAECYKEFITGMLEALKIDCSKLEFIKGSSFQLGHEYMLEVLQMAGNVTLNRTKRAASEVVRFKEEPKLGGFLYPLMQIEDVAGLQTDVCLGGVDQRGIYMLGRELLPLLKHKKPLCVFVPLIPSLTGEKMGGKMSSSDNKSKISLLDSEEEVNKKINSAQCITGEVKDNGLLVFLQYVIFPYKGEFEIKRDEKYGGNKIYKDYQKLEKDFAAKKIHPLDFKKALASEINELLKPIRHRFKSNKNQKLLKRAYPQ